MCIYIIQSIYYYKEYLKSVIYNREVKFIVRNVSFISVIYITEK